MTRTSNRVIVDGYVFDTSLSKGSYSIKNSTSDRVGTIQVARDGTLTLYMPATPTSKGMVENFDTWEELIKQIKESGPSPYSNTEVEENYDRRLAELRNLGDDRHVK